MPFKCIKSVIIGECEEWSKEIFVRMWCAPKWTFAEVVQRHCNSTAEALQLIFTLLVCILP